MTQKPSIKGPHWTARRAIVCSAALVAASCVVNLVLRIAYYQSPTIASVWATYPHFFDGSLMLVQAALWLIIAFLASGTNSVAGFLQRTSMNNRPTWAGWIVAWAGLGLGFVNLLGVKHGWIPSNLITNKIHAGGVGAWWLFTMTYTITISPVFEEVVLRGFLYRAFRGSFDQLTSLALVVLVQTYFYWNLITQSLAALLLLLLGTAILCRLREKSVSTWDCVLFHIAYNTTVLGQWWLFIVLMSLTLVFYVLMTAKPHKSIWMCLFIVVIPSVIAGFLLHSHVLPRLIDVGGSSNDGGMDYNGDGTNDAMLSYAHGAHVRTDLDRNFDGKIDYVENYSNGIAISGQSDERFDGSFNTTFEFACGQMSVVRQDTDSNGIPDVVCYYSNGVIAVVYFQPNGTNHIMKASYFTNGVLREEAGMWLSLSNISGRVFYDVYGRPVAR